MSVSLGPVRDAIAHLPIMGRILHFADLPRLDLQLGGKAARIDDLDVDRAISALPALFDEIVELDNLGRRLDLAQNRLEGDPIVDDNAAAEYVAELGRRRFFARLELFGQAIALFDPGRPHRARDVLSRIYKCRVRPLDIFGYTAYMFNPHTQAVDVPLPRGLQARYRLCRVWLDEASSQNSICMPKYRQPAYNR